MSIWQRIKQASRILAGVSDGYEGGKQNRRVHNWKPNNRQQDLEILEDWELLTSRGRWLGRNNPWCRGAKWTLVDSIIGRGIRTRSTVRDGSGKLMSSWNAQANALYDRVMEDLDVAGRMHFHQMTRTGLMSLIESGEVLYVVRNDQEAYRMGKSLIPMKLELVEPDQIDISRDRPRSGDQNEIRRGIELDMYGRRVAYYLYAEHPNGINTYRAYQSERVPAEQVIHAYRAERPSQTRGVTWFAPIITSLWSMYEYQKAEIDAAKVASYFIYMWKREYPTSGTSLTVGPGMDDGNSDMSDMYGNEVEALSPGIGLVGGPNDDLHVIQSNRASSQAVPWLKLMLQTMGVGLHLGYSKLTGDFSGKSFSAQRSEDLQDLRGIHPLQDWHAWYVDCEVRRRAITQLIALEELPIPVGGIAQFNRNPRRWLDCKYIAPQSGYISPREETNAAFDRIRYGLSNYDIELSAIGLDIDEVHQEAADEMGLSLEEYRKVLLQQFAIPGAANGGQAVGKSQEPQDAESDA